MASVSKRKWTYKGVTKEAWTVRFKDHLGCYRQKTFERKKDADRHRSMVEHDLASGDHISPGESQTVASATKQFLEYVDAKVAIGAMRPTTGHNYHCAFRQAILPAIGHRLPLDVRSVDLERWYMDVVRTKRMTPPTASRRLWFLKKLFEFGARRRWSKGNPAEEAMKAIGRPKEQQIDTFALEDVRSVIVAANERRYNGRQRAHEMTRLAVNLAAFCGLRWGEIFGLTLGHVDLPNKAIRIRHSLDRLGTLQEPKTKAGNREVPLPEHIAVMLAEFIATWPVENQQQIIFASHSGSPMAASNFRQNAWLPLLKRAGVEPGDRGALHFHALRHFAVSWMIENGWPLTDVSAMIGHANVAMTLKVYAHVVKNKKQSASAMQQLAQRLLAASAPQAPEPLLLDAI